MGNIKAEFEKNIADVVGSATTMDKDKFVEVNGIKIHYVEEGEGPPLLLIHGGGLTAKSW
ncbi:hypothetical protein MJN76_30025, partial [Salmonella enterica subsp. enterica serovar Anatum]|nr:hypothetical protein [Salmonella enterica subsp. enterica serovar Anatum]